jgi:hypothetical protein
MTTRMLFWARPFCHGRGVPNNENGKKARRRLPLVSNAATEPAEERPPWHWVGFGAVAIFVVWLPLAYAAEAVSRRLVAAKLGTAEASFADLPRSERLTVLAMLSVPQAIALVVAGLAGGFLVTRFGHGTKRRDAAFAGLAVGVLALGLTCAEMGSSFAALVVPLLATASAMAGGALGARKRKL